MGVHEGSANYTSTFLRLGVGGWSWVLEGAI